MLKPTDLSVSTLLVLVVALVALPGPAAADAGAAATVDAIRNQAVFCEGTYALCIKAPCSPIPTLERLSNYGVERALCVCDVVKGWSMGPGACSERAPMAQGGRTYLISTYSNLFNDQAKTLSCADQDTVWAWCYGAPCVVDAKNPGKALCTCPVETGPSKGLGGDCRQEACDSIWSAATPAGDVFANDHYYRWMQQNHPQVPVNGAAPACPAAP